MNRRVAGWLTASAALAIALAAVWVAASRWSGQAEKRVRVVVPGRLVRGAWQAPEALRAIIAREQIKTIVTLTAINRDDPKYHWSGEGRMPHAGKLDHGADARLDRRPLNRWPEAADLLADPGLAAGLFPLCRRTSPHEPGPCGLLDPAPWLAGRGGLERSGRLPWARPAATADQNDKALIERFAKVQQVS